MITINTRTRNLINCAKDIWNKVQTHTDIVNRYESGDDMLRLLYTDINIAAIRDTVIPSLTNATYGFLDVITNPEITKEVFDNILNKRAVVVIGRAGTDAIITEGDYAIYERCSGFDWDHILIEVVKIDENGKVHAKDYGDSCNIVRQYSAEELSPYILDKELNS